MSWDLTQKTQGRGTRSFETGRKTCAERPGHPPRWYSPDWASAQVPVPYADLGNPQTLNLYDYVGSDPTNHADPDGHIEPPGGDHPGGGNNGVTQCAGFWSCFTNALVTDNVAGLGREDASDSSGTVGAAVGDFVAAAQGGAEALIAGPAAQVGGVAACGTGVGCLATVPAVAAGTAMEIHGGATALEGVGHLFSAALKSAEGSGETLSRLGTDKESAGRLGRKAAEAEDKIGIHGVSTTAGDAKGPASKASRSAVEQQFKVHDTPTRNDPQHRTVELPKPVTQRIADMFNGIFGR